MTGCNDTTAQYGDWETWWQEGGGNAWLGLVAAADQSGSWAAAERPMKRLDRAATMADCRKKVGQDIDTDHSFRHAVTPSLLSYSS